MCSAVIPKRTRWFLPPAAQHRFTEWHPPLNSAVFVIEALHPDGWRAQGSAGVEYWAYQEAQMRCCSDGRTYRIRLADSDRVVALVETSSCRALPAPR